MTMAKEYTYNNMVKIHKLGTILSILEVFEGIVRKYGKNYFVENLICYSQNGYG